MPDWLNIRVLATIGGTALVALVIVIALLKKLKVRLPASAITWQSFLRGQGTILAGFLLFGAALGWLSLRFLGDETIRRTDQIKLMEYRQVNLSGQPAYEELDASGYTRLSIYARATAPQASTVSIRVIADDYKPGTQASTVFQVGDAGWSRLDEPITTQHLTFIIGDAAAGATKATQADVLVYLGKG